MCEYSDWLKRFRVFPRTFSIFYLYGINEVGGWFMHLPDPSQAQANFAMAALASVAAWFKFYVDGGKDDRGQA